jgi:hypothetical protein
MSIANFDFPVIHCPKENLFYTEEYNGRIYYNKDGLRHRVAGPAYIDRFGYQGWWYNGKKHRVDGPAEINPYRENQCSWYIDNRQYKNIESWSKALVKKGYKTKDEALMLILKWR